MITSHNLDKPSWDHLIVYLEEVTDKQQLDIYLQKACSEQGINYETSDFEELKLLFQYLSKQDGLFGMIGRSMLIRSQTYESLLKLSNQQN